MEFQCGLSPPLLVKMDDGVELEEDELLSFAPFVNWATTLKASIELQFTENHPFHNEPISLRSVTIQSVDRFGPKKIGCVKLLANIQSERGEMQLPGITLLGGPSVAILMILRPDDSKNERWVIVTTGPRIPVGRLQYSAIPTGMTGNNGDFAGAAAKIIDEETGLKIPTRDLINMTALVSDTSEEGEHGEKLKPVMYLSPGGSDESVSIFLWEKVVDRQEIEALKGRLRTRKNFGEKIILNLINYEELWKVGFRDGKTVAAWALYEGLRKAKHPGLRGGKADGVRQLPHR